MLTQEAKDRVVMMAKTVGMVDRTVVMQVPISHDTVTVPPYREPPKPERRGRPKSLAVKYLAKKGVTLSALSFLKPHTKVITHNGHEIHIHVNKMAEWVENSNRVLDYKLSREELTITKFYYSRKQFLIDLAAHKLRRTT